MAILEVQNVSFSYDKKLNTALKGVSFNVEKGEYVAIIGHNGSGKSTLAKMLNALLIPDSGFVNVSEFDSRDKNALFEIRKRVGVVFQNPDNQLVASIVEDDIAFGPENLGIDREEIKKRIDFSLKAVGMEKYKKSSPENLSGGQKQRIAIAGVLALNPEILVLDESTAMLDPKGRKEVLSIVKNLNQKLNTTVIAVTHYMEEAVKADRIIVLSDGKIELSGTPEEVFKEKEKIKELGLELPPPLIVAEELRNNGVPVKDCLTEETLSEELCKLL